MKILEYPRPKEDTGIGFHWFPDFYHFSQADFYKFIPRLKAMGCSWLKLVSEPYKTIPEPFIRGLIGQGIEPVVRLYTRYVEPFDQEKLRAVCQAYAAMGLHYLHVYNEPNLNSEWREFDYIALTDRYMDMLLPCLETMYSVEGIVPLLPPLAPGGNYRDILFLADVLDVIKMRGKSYLFNKLGVCIHDYAANKPLDWGRGGARTWPCAQPTYTPPTCQDSNGFRQFEWYDEIIRSRVGHPLPLLASENGVSLGNQDLPDYPRIDEELHAKRSVEMCQMTMNNEVPHYFFNNAFWVVSTTEDNPWARQRWFKPDGSPLLPRTIAAMEAMPKRSRPLVPTFDIPSTIRVLMPDGRVEFMDLDEYLKGVIPAEIGPASPFEALKAQAIASRSYAVTNRRHLQEGADVCTTTHCQLWRPERYPETDRAVEETRGLVATYEDEIIQAFYFAHCDGRTRNSEDVWQEALPYCRSVPCPRPYYELMGHGVGMCQAGAIAMAEGGRSAEEIIRHYYTGTAVSRASIAPPIHRALSVIQGRLRNADGAPQDYLWLVLRMGGWQAWLPTDEEGRFRYPGLPAGEYSLQVAETNVKKEGIRLDGRNAVTVDLTIPTSGAWVMDVDKRPGLKLLIGILPRSGIPVTIADPWGNTFSTTSGSKPEYGPGGFELPIWHNGIYTIRFEGQSFPVEIVNQTVIVTFREAPTGTPSSRLVTNWMALAEAEGLLAELERYKAYLGLFQLEKTGEGPGGGWKMTVEKRPGIRLLIGILPSPGISVTVADPWGNVSSLASGSKPEYGPGGFELPIWHNGVYTIRFWGQSFPVEIVNQTVIATFKEEVGERGRLVGRWWSQKRAGEWLQHFERYRPGAFKVEKS
ncbi:MAG: SpoIID/LytB domain-containing protein [Anaerolineae bacterium]